MSHIGLADLLGVRTKSIQWERPLLFIAALFCSDLVWLVIRPTYEWLSGESYSFRIGSANFWLNNLLCDLVLVILATLALRWLPPSILAVTTTGLGYVLLAKLINLIVYNVMPGFDDVTIRFWDLRDFLFIGLSAMFLLGALGLAGRRIKPLWLAILVGAWVSKFALMLAMIIIYNFPNLELRDFTNQIGLIPFQLLEATIFALVLWAGLRLTVGRDLTADRKEPRLLKGFYLVAVMTSIGSSFGMFASIMFSTSLGRYPSRSATLSAFTSIGIAGVIGIFGSIVFLVLTYRMWNAIQDGHARTTPGRAVGLLFVPFFNLYWFFQAYPGFAIDFNSFAHRHSLNAPRLPTGLFVAYGAFAICSAIPVIGWLFVAANFFVMLAMISKICDAVNSIPEKLPDQAAGGPAFHAP